MSNNRSETKAIKSYDNREAKMLRSLLFEGHSILTFTPFQVILASIGFIFIVYMLHFLIKIFPSTSPVQTLVAIIVLCVSAAVSFILNKK